jgi:hypothetical protein
MLLVQEYLREHSFRLLEEEHGVEVNFGATDYKASFNYSQISSREDDLLSCQCRGLILSSLDGSPIKKDDNWKDVIPGEMIVLSCPMFRFFNAGQNKAEEKIDWNDPNLQVLEKRDGSLCLTYFDPFISRWCIGTRSRNEADVPISGSIFTFRTLFEHTLKEMLNISFDDWTAKLDKRITYCFELTSPYAPIVVRHNDNRLTFLSARSLDTLKELDARKVDTFGIPYVSSYSFSSLSEIMEYVSKQDPLQHEGIVVLDSSFNRIKVKNINYVLLNRTRDTLVNDRAFISLVLNEKVDDVFQVLPSMFQERVLALQELLSEYVHFLDEKFSELRKKSETKKEFALLVQAEKVWGAPLYQMFDGKCSSTLSFLHKNRGANGEYGDNFLDKLLIEIGAKNES